MSVDFRAAAADGAGCAARDRERYAEELPELAAVQAAGPFGPADREAIVAALPVVAAVECEVPSRPELWFQNVKTLARLAADPGSIAGFVQLQGLEGEAAGPPAPHVTSFVEAVPVTPSKLQKAVARALEAQFGGAVRKLGAELEDLRVEVPRGRMVLMLDFAGKGWRAMSKQMGYSLWADLDRARMVPTSYEALWLLPAQWDLLTPSNVEAAAAHLVRVVEARLALG